MKKKYVIVSWVEDKDKVLFSLATKTEAIKKIDSSWLGVELNEKKTRFVGRDLGILVLPKEFKDNGEFSEFLKENHNTIMQLVTALKEFFRLRSKVKE